MENPLEVILDKLTNIENRLSAIEAKLLMRKKDIAKKKMPLITDDEARKYLLKTVFKVKIID
ncbi:MAG: hypothetical protein GZ086_14625 [Gelidibacter sp.]|nr:hypothetical protein [Gelidibacter sp.]